jgi:Mg-chelatase subunit ChlD
MVPARYAFFDGSNLTLGLASRSKREGIFLFCVAFKYLSDIGFKCTAFFDQSVFRMHAKKFPQEDISLLDCLIRASNGDIAKVGYTDDLLLTQATKASGYVVSHTDKYRTWTDKTQLPVPPVIRVKHAGSRIYFDPENAALAPFSITIPSTVELFGIRVEHNEEEDGVLIEKPELAPTGGISLTGRLIVLALDASGSMCNRENGANDTYDGRFKSDHLNEVLRDTIRRLARSNVRDSFYISIVNFAGAASVRSFKGKQMLNVEEAAVHIGGDKFNYLEGARGDGTNIADALRVSIDLIDKTLANHANKRLHDEWHALVILFTDGRHTGQITEVTNIARQTAITHTTLASGNIRIACVGVGKDCDANLLKEISSEAETDELTRLKRAQLKDFLYGSSLVVLVSEKSDRYGDIIRNFVDVVSHTV